jgi:RNA polymerase sigma factor (sigma-70 family)
VRSRRRGASLEELEQLYRSRVGELRRVAAAIVGDRDAALDVVQDAFATAVRQRGAFRGEGSLDGWLWRIVVNAARDELRRRARQAPVLLSGNGRVEDAAERVRAAVALLPEQQRLVLFLRYYADLDYRTIANSVGISPGTVGATLNTARESVRRHLEEVRR